MGNNYFQQCSTVAEVKKEYRRLVFVHHPDIGGDLEAMKAINVAYHEALKRQSGRAQMGTDSKERTYNYDADIEQSIIDKIDEILAAKLDGIEIWLIGLWVWVMGETKQHSKALGKNGLKLTFHGKRKCWYWKPYAGKSFYNTGADINDLAAHYGAKKFTKQSNSPKQVKA